MNDLRTAAQQALEACEQRLPLVGQATIIDELNALRTALAQEQAEPAQEHEDWCASVTELLLSCPPRKAPCNCKPAQSPSTPKEKEMTDSNSVFFSLNTGAFPVEMLRLDGSGFHYKGKVIEDAGEAYNLFKQWLAMAHQQAEPAQEPVAWMFTDADNQRVKFLEWQKETWGYSGAWIKTPLYTAPPKAEPAQDEPVHDRHGACPTHCCPIHGCKYMHDDCPVVSGAVKPVYPRNNGCESCAEDALAQQAEPVQKPVNAAIKAVEEGK